MEVIQVKAPDKLLKVFQAGLGTDDRARAAQLRFSLPVYTLSLPDTADPLQVRIVGWQFLTWLRGSDSNPDGELVMGDVPNETDADPATSLARGITIEDAWKAYGEVVAHPDVLKGSFVLRRLRISALRLDAFWLKASSTGTGATGQEITVEGTSIGTEQTAPATDSVGAGDLVFSFVAFQPELKFKLVAGLDFAGIVRRLSKETTRNDSPRLKMSPDRQKRL